jgi:homoserine dehydrogenase
MGCTVKLIARCELGDDGKVSVGVHPTMVPLSHPLAGVRGAYNAIFIESWYAGRLMFLGPGAGGAPTASAVMGDIVTAARNRARGTVAHSATAYVDREIMPPGEERSKFYLSLRVVDRPGVLAEVAATFARHDVSLQTVRQYPGPSDIAVQLNVMTHPGRLVDVTDAIAELEKLDSVSQGITMMRVEGE